MSADNATTLTGGAAGLALLATVRWEAIPHGELVKIGVAVGLAIFGYIICRDTA